MQNPPSPGATAAGRRLSCRFCGAGLIRTFVDLGSSPLANDYLRDEDLARMEAFYPLRVFVCDRCLLVQLPSAVTPERIFHEYAYFSSYSTSWLAHAKAYAEMAVARFGLGRESLVVELASNDGYLLQYFREMGIPVLGIEPAANVAAEAARRGIPTRVEFFNEESARAMRGEGLEADLIVANNVLAHVPDLNSFVAGMRHLLRRGGTLTLEFPHLLQLISLNQFDTIYHEHLSYFSFHTAREVMRAHGLDVFDVEGVPTHGGSLRLYVRHAGSGRIEGRVAEMEARERAAGLDGIDGYVSFEGRVWAAKRKLLEFLIRAREGGKRLAGYGAPAKGNTLLNYCGIRTDFLEYTVDRSPHKQGLYLPGTRIPIRAPETVFETRPDYLLILPWNLCEEITKQMAGIRGWGGQFILPIPEVKVV